MNTKDLCMYFFRHRYTLEFCLKSHCLKNTFDPQSRFRRQCLLFKGCIKRNVIPSIVTTAIVVKILNSISLLRIWFRYPSHTWIHRSNEFKRKMDESFTWSGPTSVVLTLLTVASPQLLVFPQRTFRGGGFAYIFFTGIVILIFAVPIMSLQVELKHKINLKLKIVKLKLKT